MSAPDVFVLVNAADGDAPALGGIHIRDDSVQRYGHLAHAQFRFWFWHECCEPGKKWLLNLTQTWDVANGKSVTVIVDALRQLMARHEALRTTYGFNDAHEPVQRVHQIPQLTLAEFGPGSAASGREASARLRLLLTERDFALDSEFPFRAGIVVDGKAVTVIAVFHHSIADAQAILVLRDEFLALTEGLPIRAEEELWHPVDQAFEEQSATGRRRSDAALAWLSEVYQTIPPSPVVGPPLGAEDRLHADGPRYRLLWMDSAQALRNMRSAARIFRVTPYCVLVSAYIIILALASGNSCVAILSGYSNRHRRNARRSVMCLVQDIPIFHRVEPEMKFSQVLRDMSLTCFTAFYSGNYALDRLEELRAAAEDERGIRLTRKASLNYIELDSQTCPSPTAEGIPRWAEVKDPSIYTHDINLVVYEEHAFLRFEFNMCTDVVSPTLAKAIILALRSCLAAIGEGLDPSARELGEMLKIPAPARQETWREVAGCVVDLAAVRSLLLQHPDVIEAGVFTTTPAPAEANVGAYVCAYVYAVSRLQIGELRHFIITRLGEYRLAAVPRIFIVTKSAPADPGSENEWRLQPMVCRGTGKGDLAPGTRRRGPGIVEDVATRLGALREADPGLGYLQQGGRLTMVPAIVRQLRKAGYGGLTPADFLGHWTMSELSARLTKDD
jgi:Condensation domain